MIIKTRSFANRNLKKYCSGYVEKCSQDPLGNNLIISENDEYVGVYNNPLGTKDRHIHITQYNLIIDREGRLITIPFTSIKEHHIRGIAKAEDKLIARYIDLELIDGTIEYLEIAGGKERSRDIFIFTSFLMSTIKWRLKEEQELN